MLGIWMTSYGNREVRIIATATGGTARTIIRNATGDTYRVHPSSVLPV